MIAIKKELLNQALQLAYKGKKAGYERLEFLGDRVVGLVVSEVLYTRFPKENEGDMAKRFVTLTNETALAEIAKKIGIPDMLKTNEDELRHNSSILSDVCEAVIAALYLDKGLEAVKEFMAPLWNELLESEREIPQDVKSTVQEFSQRKYKKLPVYTLKEQTGPDHQPIFKVELMVGKQKILGIGLSKKLAEKNAAETFLKGLENGHK